MVIRIGDTVLMIDGPVWAGLPFVMELNCWWGTHPLVFLQRVRKVKKRREIEFGEVQKRAKKCRESIKKGAEAVAERGLRGK